MEPSCDCAYLFPRVSHAENVEDLAGKLKRPDGVALGNNRAGGGFGFFNVTAWMVISRSPGRPRRPMDQRVDAEGGAPIESAGMHNAHPMQPVEKSTK